jgi:hypothetical protein
MDGYLYSLMCATMFVGGAQFGIQLAYWFLVEQDIDQEP